jgi:hypothetical protein
MRLLQGADAVAHLPGDGEPARRALLPPLPQPGEPHPEEAIGRTKPPASNGLLLHSQVMLVRRNLELHGPACVEE